MTTLIEPIAKSIRKKVMWVVLATTFASLLLAGTTMVVYEWRNYENNRAGEVQSLANIIARASAPAIMFDDAQTARENLALLKVRPQIWNAAIYRPNGALFATYSQAPTSAAFPTLPGTRGYAISGDRIALFHRIVENNEVIGTLYISGRYQPLERLKDYLAILGAVMLAAMTLAIVISSWLQGAITRPILDITRVTREVKSRRDFSLRASKSTADEIGELADAFNGMLSEVEERSNELEIINVSLKHEMNEKAQAVAALREADRHKDEFLATLAHELRNPLAPLRNGLEILRMPGADTAISARAREMMERQLKHMVRLVDDLLDVSRITTGKLVVKKECVELQAVIHSAVETARPLIETRRHALELDVPAAPIWLDADATRLAQVVSNLLNNAARYTEPGGLIEINVSLKDAGVEISVSDNGIGIPSGLLPTIFDMFTQADQSLERRQAGLGVGLTLARKLIELHGGTIEARSAGLGHGSKFVVPLPVAAGQGQSALPVKDLSAQATATQNQRILLADDNVDFVNSMATLLSAKGHDVRVAHDGVQALKLARDFNPDYAFLDIGMPMMNGYELARRLGKLMGEKTVLTAVSGWGQHGDRLRAVEAGFKHHLVKPVEFEQLEAIILMRPVAT